MDIKEVIDKDDLVGFKKIINELGYTISDEEVPEFMQYMRIFLFYGCDGVNECNDIVTKHGRWDDFKTFRTLNSHNGEPEIYGIAIGSYTLALKLAEKYQPESGKFLTSQRKY